MSLANPLFLLGVFLVAIPIAIHLWKRRVYRHQPFSSLALLQRAKQKVEKKQKFREILLLILRCLAVVLIPLAMSRPYLTGNQGEGTPQAVVFVVDTSFRMGYGEPTHLALAQEKIFEELSTLGAADTALLLTSTRSKTAEPPVLSPDLAAVRRAVDALEVSASSDSVQDTLVLAKQTLQGATQPLRRVVLLTNATEASLQGFSAATWGQGGPKLEVIDVSGGELPNHAVVDVSVAPSAVATHGVAVTARIANHSAAPMTDLPVRLLVGGKEAASGVVSAKPGETVQKVFQLSPSETKVLAGEIALAPDALPIDDRRAFVIASPAPLQVLLVNGDTRAVPYEDETFFLEEALKASREQASPIRYRTVTPEMLSTLELASFDCIALANVGLLPEGTLEKIQQFVSAGGSVLVSAGEQLAQHPDVLDSLLPARIRDVFSSNQAAFSGDGLPRSFAPPTQGHPLFQEFDPTGPGAMGLAKVQKILLVEPKANDARQIVLSYDDGAPALVEKVLGSGRVLLLTTTLDREWTDLPIRPGYVPFVQNLFYYMAGVLQSQSEASTVAGAEKSLRVTDTRVARAALVSPKGKSRELLLPTTPGAPLVLDGLDMVGTWTLGFWGADNQSLGTRLFPVVLSSEGSQLKKVDAAVLREAERQSGDGVSKELLSEENGPSGTPLSSYLLLFLVLCLCFETVVLVRKNMLGRAVG